MASAMAGRTLTLPAGASSRLSSWKLPRCLIGRSTNSRISAAVSTVHAVAAESRPAEYAVIATPAGQQLVEEGKWFALCSESAMKASAGDGQLRFPAVAVKRTDGEFVRGELASGWIVEAELLEEAFALQAAKGGRGASNTLGKVLVTKIKHTEETRRKIEEALML